MLTQILSGYTMTNHVEFLLKHIANEMILDNVENSLLNGIVVSQNNGNEVIKRETESVLLNMDDIYKWIKTYQQFDV